MYTPCRHVDNKTILLARDCLIWQYCIRILVAESDIVETNGKDKPEINKNN